MPQYFTNAEYADIHFVYGFCNGSAEAAVQEYRRRFPNRRLPSAQVFITTHRRIAEYGVGKINDRQVYQNPRDNRILHLFDINRNLSTRRAALQLQVSQTKIIKTLKRDHRKAFHLRPVQNLLPGDAEKRTNFCRSILEKHEHDPNFLHRVLWTDECNFTRRGVVNYHNLHVWSHENPYEIRPSSFQHEFSFNIWLGVLHNTICGPYFLPHRLNSVLFLQFLENDLHELMDNVLDDLPLHLRDNQWIQMDGAPAHYGRQVRQWLDENYVDRWIGRLPPRFIEDRVPGVGPVAWPPRSPDLNPLDYFVWGFLKEKIYGTPVTTRDELRNRIEEHCDILREEHVMIRASINNIIKRCQKCIDAGGLHFEQLL